MCLFYVRTLAQWVFVFASILALLARSNHKLLIGDIFNYPNRLLNGADKSISLPLFCIKNSSKELHKL